MFVSVNFYKSIPTVIKAVYFYKKKQNLINKLSKH